jgi:CRISP-associated protein Cas1
MAWRGVHISKPARLSHRDKQIVVEQDDAAVTLPLEDIAWLVLDTPQITITGALLSALSDAGVALIVPDAKHNPSGVLLPFHRHHAQAAIAHAQVTMSQPLKKRLWQHLIVSKIENQAAVLAALGVADAKPLKAMATLVNTGDPENVEARAARLYWSKLFEDFKRQDEDDRRNSLLNYGYAVVRAAIARACVANGLIPAFGLHHASKTNAFNLVDDVIEPFRPLVDTCAWTQAKTSDGVELSVDDRRVMAAVLNDNCRIGKERLTLLAATEIVSASLVAAIEHNSAALLKLPTLDWTP